MIPFALEEQAGFMLGGCKAMVNHGCAQLSKPRTCCLLQPIERFVQAPHCVAQFWWQLHVDITGQLAVQKSGLDIET